MFQHPDFSVNIVSYQVDWQTSQSGHRAIPWEEKRGQCMDDHQVVAISSSQWEQQQQRAVVVEGRLCLQPHSSACLPCPVMFFNTDLLMTNSTLWEWSTGEEGSQTAPRTGWNLVLQGEQLSGGSVCRGCLTSPSSCYLHLDTSADDGNLGAFWGYSLVVRFFLFSFCFVLFLLFWLI